MRGHNRLVEEGIGPRFLDLLDHVGDIGVRETNHRNAFPEPRSANALDDFYAAQPRKHHIQQNRIWPRVEELCHKGAAIRLQFRFEPRIGQACGVDAASERVVFCN